MSKHIVRTFSRVFPSYHPRAGEPTYFVEKIWNSVGMPSFGAGNPWGSGWKDTPLTVEYARFIRGSDDFDDISKHHTIRAGHHFKPGDFLVPRVWSGKPYASKQIQFAPPIEIVKTWDFEMDVLGVCSISKPGEQQTYTFCFNENLDDLIAQNDGLSHEDFYWWFSRSPSS